MLYNRAIRNRTGLFFGSHRRIREFPRPRHLLRIVPLENTTAPVWGTQYIYDSQGRTTATVRYKNAQVAVSTAGESSVVSTGTEVYRSQTVYNSKGQVYQSIDANGNTTTYEYDNLDRQVATTDTNGLRNETVYNTLGQVIESRIIANGQTKSTFYVYDRFGNVVQTTYPDGTSISATYNDEGQKISETNQLGQTRTFEYSETGQLTAVVLPGNLRYEYAYDVQGNQTLIRDPNGHETRFTYDENGNQLTRTLPLGFGEDGIFGTEDDESAKNPDGSLDFTEQFEYDDFGRTIKALSFEGIVTTYSYDEYGRLSAKSFFENQAAYEAQTTTEVWSYEYDAYGRAIQVSQNGRLTNTTYTSEGYVASITTPEGTVSYAYDDFGRQTSVSDGESNTAYTYDSVGRLATVTGQAGTTTYSYDVYGNLAKVVTATGSGNVTTTYEYDSMNRLTRLTNFSDANSNGVMDEGEGVSQFDYTLDALGKKTHATETFWFDNNEDDIKDANVNNIDWNYDQQSRLVREVFDHYNDEFDQTLDWTYDEVGNRMSQNLDKGNDSVIDELTRYYYDANDRLIDELFDGQNDNTFEEATHYGYDHTQQTAKTVTENGVITSDSTFEYNALGQMSVVTITKYTDSVASSIERTTYGYGSDGIRVSALQEIDSNADGTYDTAMLTEYLNDPNNHTGYSQVLKTTEYSIDGETRTVTKEIFYTIGLDQIAQSVTTSEGTESHYFTYDGHGSTRALLDATAAILQLYSFDAYGNALGFNPAEALTEYLYSGEQFDSKIGQQYLRARYYDPVTGRFNSLDSFFGNLSDPQSLHKYLYAHADPVNMIDPSGRFGLGGVMISAAFNTNFQSLSVNFYETSYELSKIALDGMDMFYNVQILQALAALGSLNAITYLDYLPIFCTALKDGIISKIPTYNPNYSAGQIDDQAQLIIEKMMKKKGFIKESVIALKNGNGHGIDLIGISKNGELHIIEIKGHQLSMTGDRYNSLSGAQKDVDRFIMTRLNRAAGQTNNKYWKDTNVTPQVRDAAKKAIQWMEEGKPVIKKMIHVDYAFRSWWRGGAKVLEYPWKKVATSLF